jgi:Putative metal-binding motif
MKRNVLWTALLLAACGNGEKIEVSVNYAASANASEVAALRAWVVTGTEGHEASCNLLVAGAQEPYDVELQLLCEGGARSGETLTATACKGEGIVYVVAFDYAGDPLYAGCSTDSNSSVVNVTLGTLHIYDCADPSTPPGARCDDGNICTVGDHCRAGQCAAGAPRDCSALNGLCKVGVCDPAVGCKQVPANEGQSCEDGLYCTTGTCTGGTCVSSPLTCPTPPSQCLKSVCDEQFDRCLFLPRPNGTACDDGNPCRTGDSCDTSGTCVAGTTPASDVTVECDRNACTANDQCSAGTCVPGTTPSGATSCNQDSNPCTIDYCSGTLCVLGGYASSTTPCWDTNSCSILDRCSGSSSSCVGGTWDYDYDGDGCNRPPSSLCAYTSCLDCDDADANTNANAPERCSDNKDNNCNGSIDEAGCVP